MVRLIHLYRLLLITATTPVRASRLSPRKSVSSETYDPYIACEGAGPNYDEGLPHDYSLDDYALNLDLCSAVHGVRQHNVGCYCTQPRGNVRCDQGLADQVLWNAIYRSFDPAEIQDAIARGFYHGDLPFPEYCWSNCLCVDAMTAHENAGSSDSLATSLLHRFRAQGLTRAQRNGTTAAAAAAGWVLSRPHTFGEAHIQGGSAQLNGHPAVQTQCGNDCTTDRDCKGPAATTAGAETAAGQGSNCTCRTQSQQYQPGSGAVAFVAACLIDMATGGKRDEEWPCPCNGSYVSHGCCGAENGLVWEAAELKLGELVT